MLKDSFDALGDAYQAVGKVGLSWKSVDFRGFSPLVHP